jgi:hypothetical protein
MRSILLNSANLEIIMGLKMADLRQQPNQLPSFKLSDDL